LTTSGAGVPPIFSESDKFNGTNWLSWKENIMIVIEARGAEGYLNGLIMKPGLTIQSPRIALSKAPASMSTTPTPSPAPVDPTPLETSWDSPNPSAREWKHRNTWTKMLLLFNTKEPTGLGIDTSGSTADAWKSDVAVYKMVSLIAQLNAKQELRNITFAENGDFPAHIILLHNKLSYMRSQGAEITKRNFVAIVLNLLPPS